MATERMQEILVPATFGAVRVIDAAIVDLLAQAGADEFTIYNVQLAAHEVCTNIVEHAYVGQNDGTITARLRVIQAPHPAIEIELLDQGQPFDPQSVPAPDLDQPQEGGYGLFLAQTLLDELHYQHGAQGNLWRLRKRLQMD